MDADQRNLSSLAECSPGLWRLTCTKQTAEAQMCAERLFTSEHVGTTV